MDINQDYKMRITLNRRQLHEAIVDYLESSSNAITVPESNKFDIFYEAMLASSSYPEGTAQFILQIKEAVDGGSNTHLYSSYTFTTEEMIEIIENYLDAYGIEYIDSSDWVFYGDPNVQLQIYITKQD
jgi:hypothetical protein